MTQVGGPAAINGFLYQILNHLQWLADARLCNENGKDALLVLEPRSGGDAHLVGQGKYLAEQYKTRPDGTWSVSDIVPVLKDLRKAVPTPLPDEACYRFVTDGRAGRLKGLQSFLAHVRSISGPDELDNNERQAFASFFTGTARGFFDDLVGRIEVGSDGHQSEQLLAFHLLSRFEMEFEVSGEGRARAVEARLRPFVPNLGDESGIREPVSYTHLTLPTNREV